MSMAHGIIWAAALAAYVLFRLWYDNWSGPLKQSEVDAFLAKPYSSKLFLDLVQRLSKKTKPDDDNDN